MKYAGIYWTLFAPMMKKSIEKRFNKELAEKTIRNGKPQLVTHEQTLWQLEMLETGVRDLR
jgi:hypothetical protein